MKFLLSLMVAAVVMGPGMARAEQIRLPDDVQAVCALEGLPAETCLRIILESGKGTDVTLGEE